MISLVHLVQPAEDGVFDFDAGSSGFFAATISGGGHRAAKEF